MRLRITRLFAIANDGAQRLVVFVLFVPAGSDSLITSDGNTFKVEG